MLALDMTDIHDIRLTNTKKLAASYGTLASFAERIDRAATQVSRFMGKNPSKKIGNNMARHIEQCLGKPEGWLDREHYESAEYKIGETPTQPRNEKSLLHSVLTSGSDDIELLKSVIATVEEIAIEEQITLSPDQKAQAIVSCLKTCMSRGVHLSASKEAATAALYAVI